MCSHKNRLIEAILRSTHNIPFSIYIRKSAQIIPNLQPRDFFQGTQRRVLNSRGKRAISVRATEVLLYYDAIFSNFDGNKYGVFPGENIPFRGGNNSFRTL